MTKKTGYYLPTWFHVSKKNEIEWNGTFFFIPLLFGKRKKVFCYWCFVEKSGKYSFSFFSEKKELAIGQKEKNKWFEHKKKKYIHNHNTQTISHNHWNILWWFWWNNNCYVRVNYTKIIGSQSCEIVWSVVKKRIHYKTGMTPTKQMIKSMSFGN